MAAGVRLVYGMAIIGISRTVDMVDIWGFFWYLAGGIPLSIRQEVLMPDSEVKETRGRPGVTPEARRYHMPVTVAQGTIGRMDELCARFSTTRGRLIDKLVEVLHRSYVKGRVYCVHGDNCRIDRTDLPDVF